MWSALFLLGCYHGLNPGMDSLSPSRSAFKRRRTVAVLRSIVPLTLGHLLSVALIVLIAIFASFALPNAVVHYAAAGILISFGIYRLVRARHIRWVGMRVGFWGLTLGDFLCRARTARA